MDRTPYLLPKPSGRLMSMLAAYPGSLLFVTGVNLALAGKLPPDARRSLEGK